MPTLPSNSENAPSSLARNQAAADLFSSESESRNGPGDHSTRCDSRLPGPVGNAFDSPGRTADCYGHFPNGHAFASKLSGELVAAGGSDALPK
jgi:hypothetical protein